MVPARSGEVAAARRSADRTRSPRPIRHCRAAAAQAVISPQTRGIGRYPTRKRALLTTRATCMTLCVSFLVDNHTKVTMRLHLVKIFFVTALLAANTLSILAADAAKPSPAVEKVLAYLQKHKEKHKLDDPAQQLLTELEERDGGGVHVRLHQVYEGVMVRGTLISAWVSPGGTVDVIRLDTRQIAVKTTTPAVSRDRAYAIAVNDLKAPGGVSLDTSGTYLEIIPKGINGVAADTLVWTVAVSVESDVETAVCAYTINATDGSIIDHRKVLPASVREPGRVAGEAATPLYRITGSVLRSAFWGDFRVYTSQAGTKKQPYTLQDPCYGVNLPLPTCNTSPTTDKDGYVIAPVGNTAHNATNQNNIRHSPIFATGTSAFDGYGWHVLVPWFGNGQRDNSDPATAGADVFIGVRQVSYMLYALFNRESGVNGTDQRFDLFVHAGNGAGGEASWNQTPIINPSTYTITSADLGIDARGLSRTNATAPDIIAHECGHGLNRATYLKNVSGPTTSEGMAIEEANADIFAAIFEWSMSVQGHRNMVPEWIAEQSYFDNWNGSTFTPQVALRYMDNPPRDAHPDPAAPARTILSPACYTPTIGSLDQHYANGPYNHLFYLLATGGTNQCDAALTVPSIGYAAAAQIWFKAMKSSLPGDGYQQLKVTWLAAASAIYGAGTPQVAAVQAAFDGVHVP